MKLQCFPFTADWFFRNDGPAFEAPGLSLPDESRPKDAEKKRTASLDVLKYSLISKRTYPLGPELIGHYIYIYLSIYLSMTYFSLMSNYVLVFF